MKDKVIQIIWSIINAKGSNSIEVIQEDDHLRDCLGLDSFDLAEMTVKIEDEFGVDVFETGIVNSVSEILNKLELK